MYWGLGIRHAVRFCSIGHPTTSPATRDGRTLPEGLPAGPPAAHSDVARCPRRHPRAPRTAERTCKIELITASLTIMQDIEIVIAATELCSGPARLIRPLTQAWAAAGGTRINGAPGEGWCLPQGFPPARQIIVSEDDSASRIPTRAEFDSSGCPKRAGGHAGTKARGHGMPAITPTIRARRGGGSE